LGIGENEIRSFRLLRRSLDARSGKIRFLLRYAVGLHDETESHPPFSLKLRDVGAAEPALIVGFGPAGMFAALRLIELGIKPVVIEQGRSVRNRRHDLAAITKRGAVNPKSNYCFGEGGAGTFSDGKLYTRANKRGSIERILHIFVSHGADADILIEAHPHIGTNKLPGVVQAIRDTILNCGGEVLFEKEMDGLLRSAEGIRGLRLTDGQELRARAVLLAAGHSARNLFSSLHREGYSLEYKPFALGVRVEHPQQLIDEVQYHRSRRPEHVPPASYSLVAQCSGRGVFSFCMCPGGIICPAATADDEVVVNGWSPSKRNSYFANSGIVVQVDDSDLLPYKAAGPLAGLALQRALEQRAFDLGGGKQKAPAQRLDDFVHQRSSTDLPRCSYLPGITPANLEDLFPQDIFLRLREGFRAFEEQKKGFLTNEAVVVGIESRTSSPLRIPRDRATLMHPQAAGLFPAGEGGGYAGGIVSAAMDGEGAAAAIGRYYGIDAEPEYP
jgi:uncharacterized FAD-dependent dehydrogenase